MGGGGDGGAGGAGGRVVEDAEAEHLGRDPADHVVHHGPGDRAVLHVGLQRRAEVGVERLLHVGAVDRPLGAVQGGVVGGHEPGEAPALLEDLGLQVGVLAGEVAVDHRVGAHHRGHLGLGHGLLEGGQVDLVQGPVAHDHVVGRGIAVRLLVVGGEVLYLRHLALGLHAADLMDGEGGVEERVLGERLERPAPAGVAQDVDGGAEVDRGALAPFLLPDDRAVPARQRGVEGGGQRRAGRQLGDPGQPISDAERAVFQAYRGNAQRRLCRHIENVGLGRALAFDHGDLIGEGHLGQQQLDPLRDGQRPVQPGTAGVRGLAGRGRGGAARVRRAS